MGMQDYPDMEERMQYGLAQKSRNMTLAEQIALCLLEDTVMRSKKNYCEYLSRLYDDGVSLGSIGDILGMTESGVGNKIIRYRKRQEEQEVE